VGKEYKEIYQGISWLTQELFKMAFTKARELSILLMEPHILACSKLGSSTIREFWPSPMATLTVEGLGMESMKDTGSLFGKMEIFTKGSMWMEKDKAMVFCWLTRFNIQAVGRKELDKAEVSLSKQTSKYSVTGGMTSLSKNDSLQ
jgi:hypothetical protein